MALTDGTSYNIGTGATGKGVAVADVVAKTGVAVAALTATQTPAGTYSSNEQALLAAIKVDLAAIRTQVNALVTDMANSRTYEAAVKASLHNGGVIA
jgi:GH24 family phage-related lysozyme (muramidase)